MTDDNFSLFWMAIAIIQLTLLSLAGSWLSYSAEESAFLHRFGFGFTIVGILVFLIGLWQIPSGPDGLSKTIWIMLNIVGLVLFLSFKMITEDRRRPRLVWPDA